MTRRIVVNLAAFGVLGLLLTVWALGNVITLNVPERYYDLRAEFVSSPGLQPGFDVAYLGVTVGKIHSVRLQGRKVVANLDIDRDQRIPGNVIAVAGRKSAIGEPYVSLELPTGATGTTPMARGTVIPLARTSVASSYDELFIAANKAVTGLNAQDLRTFTHELAAGWDGRADSLQKMLDGAGQLTGTFARDSEVLDGLIGELTTTTNMLTARRDRLAGGVDDMSQVMDTLARNGDELKRLTDQAPGLLTRFKTILARTRAQNDCTLKNLGTAMPAILDGRSLESLEYAESHAKQLVKVFKEVAPPDEEPASLHIDFVITGNEPKPAPEYKNLKPLPDVGSIPSCPGVRVPPVKTRAAANRAGTPAAAGTAGSGGAAPSGTEDTTVRNAAQKEQNTSRTPWLIYLPPLIAVAVLSLTSRRTLMVVWHNRRRRTRGG